MTTQKHYTCTLSGNEERSVADEAASRRGDFLWMIPVSLLARTGGRGRGSEDCEIKMGGGGGRADVVSIRRKKVSIFLNCFGLNTMETMHSGVRASPLSFFCKSGYAFGCTDAGLADVGSSMYGISYCLQPTGSTFSFIFFLLFSHLNV